MFCVTCEVDGKRVLAGPEFFPDIAEADSYMRRIDKSRKPRVDPLDASNLAAQFEGGTNNVLIRHPICAALVAAMVEWFKDTGATNYVELTATHPDTGDLVFTMQRKEGKTAHELRQEALAELSAAQTALDVAEGKMDDIRSILVDCSGKYTCEVDRTVAISAVVGD